VETVEAGAAAVAADAASGFNIAATAHAAQCGSQTRGGFATYGRPLA